MVAGSEDDGRTFDSTVIASPNSGLISSPAIAVGPGTGPGTSSIWVSFFAGDTVYAAGLIDGPDANGGFSEPEPVSPDGSVGGPVFDSIAVGPGGAVVVDWESGNNAQGPEDVYVSVDPDGLGPLPFAPPSPDANTDTVQRVVHSLAGAAETGPANPVDGFNLGAKLAWDTAKRNRLYMVYTDRSEASAGSQDTVIRLIFSDDGGKTWSDPVQVSDSQDSTQFQPSIAVDPTTGDVAVGWYDTAGDPSRQATHYRIAVSTDGGVTFAPDQVVALGTSNASDPGLSDSGKDRGYGDSSGLAFANGVVFAAWAENSASLEGNPDPGAFDVAVARIGIGRVKESPVTVLPLAVTAVEGQEFDGPVAIVTNPDPNLAADNYTALIDWGDGGGTPDITSGVIEESSSGDVEQLTVQGNHLYKEVGAYPIVVTVLDAAQGVASTTATDITTIEGNQVGGVIASLPTDPVRYFVVSRTEPPTGLFAAVSVDGGGEWDPVERSTTSLPTGPMACRSPPAPRLRSTTLTATSSWPMPTSRIPRSWCS